MKTLRNLLPLIFAASLLFTAIPNASSQTATWKQIPIPQLPAFHPPQPKRIQLENGMVIFLQEDHELPLINGTARIRGGSSNEPAAKTGTAGSSNSRRSLFDAERVPKARAEGIEPPTAGFGIRCSAN